MLKKYFEIKNLGKLRYFLGLEVAYSNKVIFLCQRKYVLELIKETGLIRTKSCDTPMELNIKLYVDEEEPAMYKNNYQ